MGLEQEEVKSRVKNFTIFDIKEATPEKFKLALKNIDVVYVTGGNTYVLLDAMNKVDFKTTILDFFKNGGVYFGSSAGSIVTCPDIAFIKPMETEALDIKTKGLHLTDIAFIPHLDSPHFQNCIEDCIEAGKKLPYHFVALNDDQALWIEDNYIQLY